MMLQGWRRRHRFYRHLFALTLAMFVCLAMPPPSFRIHLIGGMLMQVLLLVELGQPIQPLQPLRRDWLRIERLAARVYRLIGLVGLLSLVMWASTPASQATLTGVPLLVVLTFFVFWSLKRLLRLLANEQTVGLEVVSGAVAGYLLLGISGGLVMTVLETFHPGSFENLARGAAGISHHRLYDLTVSRSHWDLDFSRLNYFAFVSLTTVGYGDIVPKTPPAEFASVALSVCGSLYLVIVMGLLISRFTVQTQQEEEHQELQAQQSPTQPPLPPSGPP